MRIDSAIVGTELPERTRTVDWRQTTNYAAAIGDDNPHYLDDARPEGIVAPPVFPVVITWPIVTGVGEQLPEALSPELMMTMVHGREHLIVHRPVRPGDQLILRSQVAAVVPVRAGTLVVLRIAGLAAGAPVFTEFTAGLLRGVECPDGGRGGEELPAVPEPRAEAGSLWRAEVAIERRTPYLYDGCTDIVFAIHTSRSFAQMVGLPDILLQGTVTLALAVREIVNREAGGDPLLISEIACEFRAPVIPGTAIAVELQARQGEHCHFRVVNAEGKDAIRGGYLRLTAEA